MKTTDTIYKAYIAGNKYSHAFDSVISTKSPEAALAAIKRKNSPDWKDCYTWVVIVVGDQEFTI